MTTWYSIVTMICQDACAEVASAFGRSARAKAARADAGLPRKAHEEQSVSNSLQATRVRAQP